MKRAYSIVLAIIILIPVGLYGNHLIDPVDPPSKSPSTPPPTKPIVPETKNLKTDLAGIWFSVEEPRGELIQTRIYAKNGDWRVQGWVLRTSLLPDHGAKEPEDQSQFDISLKPQEINAATHSFSHAEAIYKNPLGLKRITFKLEKGRLVVESCSFITEKDNVVAPVPLQTYERLSDPKDVRLWEEVNSLAQQQDLKKQNALDRLYDDLRAEIGDAENAKVAQSKLEDAIARVFPYPEPTNTLSVEPIPVQGPTPGLLVPFMLSVQSPSAGNEERGRCLYLWVLKEKTGWKINPLVLDPKQPIDDDSERDIYMALPGLPLAAIHDREQLFVLAHEAGTNFGGSGVLVFKRFGNEWRLTQNLISDCESHNVSFGKKNGKNSYHTVKIITQGYLTNLPGSHGSPKSYSQDDYVWKHDRYVLKRSIDLPNAASTIDNLLGWAQEKNLKKVRSCCATGALARQFMKLVKKHPPKSDVYETDESDHPDNDNEFALEDWRVVLGFGKVHGKWMLTRIKPCK